MLYGASLMPNLLVLDASDQALSGQLSACQLPTLQVLNLSNNSIQVQGQPVFLLGALVKQNAKMTSNCQFSGPTSIALVWAGRVYQAHS